MMTYAVLLNSKSPTFKGYDVFKLFTTLKLHFDGKLDLSKITHTIGNKRMYEAVKTKYHYEKIANSYNENECRSLFISNLLIRPNSWIGDMTKEDARANYLNYLGRIQSMTENYREDLKRIIKHCADHNKPHNDVFVCPDRKMPDIINMVTTGYISIESFCILDQLLKITPFLNRDLQGDPIWDSLRDKIWKYQGLLDFDISKMQLITRQLFIGK